jgi:D-aminoacyl-tRNA deacylase
MMLVLCSEPDPASMNIRERLLELHEWKDAGMMFDGNPVLAHGDWRLATISDLHLYREDLHVELKSAGIEPEGVVVASKHSSAAGRRSLTIHPLGNFGKADYGGRPSALAISFPHGMTSALRTLKALARNLDTVVSFEATHHGPYLELPTFFIEIGSSENEWSNRTYAQAITKTIFTLMEKGIPRDDPVAIGVGGGHYVPRITEVALSRRVAFGHMVPSYVADESGWKEAVMLALASTPGVSCAYIDRKSLRKSRVKEIETMLENRGLEVVRSGDLKAIS